MQPGTMITHWQTVRYAAFTFLGLIALLGALTAMLYTTASDALVAPKLKMGDERHRLLYGKVAASFANEPYIQQRCQTPISDAVDPDYAGSTCIAIENSGQACVTAIIIIYSISQIGPRALPQGQVPMTFLSARFR